MHLLGTLIIVGLGGLVVYSFMKNPDYKSKLIKGKDSPLEILQRRYAAGEITQEEFDEMKQNLEDDI